MREEVSHKDTKGTKECEEMKDVKMAAMLLLMCSCAVSCATQPIVSKQIVDVTPLSDVALMRDLQTLDPAFADYSPIWPNAVRPPNAEKNGQGVIDWRWWGGQEYDFLGVRIDVMLFDSTASAALLFDADTKEMSQPITLGGNLDNRFVIGPIKQYRSACVFGNPPSGSFYSDVFIQKRNLLIRIHERSHRRDLTEKDNTVQDLATRLARLQSAQ
jgi:hypothetical protein